MLTDVLELTAAPHRQVDIDAEIALVHGFMRDRYKPKFPKLESLVHHALDYAHMVSAIQIEMDLTCVSLEEILPQRDPALQDMHKPA